jgi:hypothetical protein
MESQNLKSLSIISILIKKFNFEQQFQFCHKLIPKRFIFYHKLIPKLPIFLSQTRARVQTGRALFPPMHYLIRNLLNTCFLQLFFLKKIELPMQLIFGKF